MVANRTTIKLMIFLFLVLLLPVFYSYADWPRWRGPNGDGISTETEWDPGALAKGPKILWKTNVGSGFTNVAIQGKYLYTMGSSDFKNDTIFCLDAGTGKKIWEYSYPCISTSYGTQATPTIDGDFVYTLSTKGHLYCFNARNGKVQWNKQIVEEYNIVCPFYGFAGSPIVEGNLLIVTGNSYGIALDKRSGKVIWTSPPWEGKAGGNTTGSLYTTPVLYTQNNKRYAAIFSGYGLYSVDVETGKPNWLYKWPHEYHAADPIIFDGRVFISTGYNVGCALLDISSEKPTVLWQNQNMNNHFSTCLLIDGYLYGCHGQAGFGEGVLRCLDVKSGKVMWQKDLGPVCLSAANTMLLILTDNGTLFVAETSPVSYKEMFRVQVFEQKGFRVHCWTPPVLCGGRIFCRNEKGDLVCIDVRK